MKIPTPRQLPSGAWFVRIMVDGKSYSITKPTEKEAIAEAMAIKLEIKEAATQKQKDKTLYDAINEYIDARRNILSPSTIRGYRIIRDNRFQGVMHSRIGAIRPEKWQSIVNAEARLVSAKTLKNSWGFISSVIHEATGEIVNVRLPQVVPNERDFLDPDQIGVLIHAVKGKRLEIAVLLALSSLRQSEILALRWADIDLKNRVLYVNGAAVPGEDGKLVRKDTTKNSSSRRAVPIIQPLYEALNEKDKRTGAVVDLSTSGMYKGINRLCEENGLPAVGVHGLRHSFASLAYHLQIPEKIAMQIGGWANTQTMHRIYTHVGQKEISKQANKFTSFFDGL